MGRISTFIVGVFIIGISRAAAVLKQYVTTVEGAPVDYVQLVEATSMVLLGLGGIIAGYALLAMIVSAVLKSYRARKRREQEERRPRPGQNREQGRGQPAQGQQPPEQQPRDQPRQGREYGPRGDQDRY